MGKKLRNLIKFIGALLFWWVVITASWVALLGIAKAPVTFTMIQQRLEQGTIQRANKSLEEIARPLPLAIIASEDQRFMTHHGFSTEQIKRSLGMKEPGFSFVEFVQSVAKKDPARTTKRGKRTKGASTISQQTAKNVFLWPGRSMTRKGLEAWFTVLIETLWTKQRILEVYLNVAEMGKGVFGAEAAARHCFGKSASRLVTSEAAIIAATLPAPRRFSCTSPSGYLRGRQQWILRQMSNVGDVLDPEVLAKRKAKLEAEERREAERRAKRRK